MRMIDADATKRRVADTFFDTLIPCVNRALDDSPTIDAVHVVRCKHCKYHEDEEIGMVYCPNVIGGWVGENWFCADGERKEGVDNG